jgi:hypothetical protein
MRRSRAELIGPILAILTHLTVARAQSAERGSSEAQAHVERGLALYEAKDYAQAAAELETAYSLKKDRDVLYALAQAKSLEQLPAAFRAGPRTQPGGLGRDHSRGGQALERARTWAMRRGETRSRATCCSAGKVVSLPHLRPRHQIRTRVSRDSTEAPADRGCLVPGRSW